ncbi:hypothetical protein PV326_010552 [Microctonus aethiopoides]|uniref:Uncharacterized protein n=1 Tax=Microctonus aethiopoides TaxID=144406 RepID=A0AA39KQZ3_9HYME|nr:hypothetical protein PV326_010552 [Microctonus aethiopoides]KAK0170635.1 hypothetical protein PV328_008462 [Microctonus aethiopoides]
MFLQFVGAGKVNKLHGNTVPLYMRNYKRNSKNSCLTAHGRFSVKTISPEHKPDISFTEVHRKAAKRVLRYLKSTSNFTIRYKQSETKLMGMRTVALSRSEAEYTAISEAVTELLYLQGFLMELNFDLKPNNDCK